MHPFHRSGIATLSDIRTEGWRQLYSEIEKSHLEFSRILDRVLTDAYKWPTDPLHTWSRVWEYPYAYYHLKLLRASLNTCSLPLVADIGSGVTFFPFAIARLEYEVTCVDIDPICESAVTRAAALVSQGRGQVGFRLTDGSRLPFSDNSFDAAYSISVLEHIPAFEATIQEIHRILKPGGMLVLTCDLDLRGDAEIGVAKFRIAKQVMGKVFDYGAPEDAVHPADILTTRNSIYPLRLPVSTLPRRLVSATFSKPLFGRRRHLLPPHLGVYGGVFLKRQLREMAPQR